MSAGSSRSRGTAAAVLGLAFAALVAGASASPAAPAWASAERRPAAESQAAWIAAGAAPAPGRAARSTSGAPAPRDDLRYWTPARIAGAKPLELSRGGGRARPPARARAHSVPFTSGPVPDPTVFPLPSNGKLFGRIRGLGDFECSATVVDAANQSVAFTAGHCVYDPFSGRFAKRLVLIPAYDSGAEPFGRFAWRELETTRQWAARANSNFDYAAIAFEPRADGALLEDVTGGRPLFVAGPREGTYNAIGYPVNRRDGQVLWNCVSEFAGTDPRPIPVGRPAIGIGCDMKAGASGGGWFDAAGRLVSVTSFGYRLHPSLLYGPDLGMKAVRLVERLGD